MEPTKASETNWLMTRREALMLCGVALGAAFTPKHSLAATQRNAQLAKLDWGEVEAKLKDSIENKTFEGVGLLLCTAEGTFYKKAFGADTTETAHLLGSATKLASTTAIMTLADDKLIRLDDPIKKYLPQFGPRRGAITIRQLFTQTHGMPAGHPSIALPLQDNGITLQESVNQIAKDDTVRYPVGSKHEYQPAVSYHIGGRIAEVVTGEVWNKLFDKRVRIPLEMETFSYGETRNPRIGGGAKCALQDYGNLVQMHLAGGVFKGRRVLSEASVREMQKDQLRGVPFTPIGRTNGYGLSWWYEEMADGSKGVQMSVPGVYGAIPWINTKLGYGGFQLVQKRLPESFRLFYSIYPIINERLSKK